MTQIEDVQNSKDLRGKNIERVGVEQIALPLYIARKDITDGLPNSVTAMIDAFVDVDKGVKGTHLSRFTELLMEYASKELNLNLIDEVLTKMIQKLKSKDAYLRIKFPYFISKSAPVSGKKAPRKYDITFLGRRVNGKTEIGIQLNLYVTNLCPCSKAISKYGAHNQRALLTVKLVPNKKLWWFEDIIDSLEAQGSCPIFALLKREDEKWVTERAYENPKFVEDLVRDISIALDNNQIEQYYIKTAAEESIHTHNAVAYITKDWKLG